MKINLNKIQEHKTQLESHPLLVTNTIQSVDDLQTFMKYHVFAVWDFMSLLKTMQHHIVPSSELWLPSKGNRSEIARMINEIVLCEESDISQDGHGAISHFDLYIQAMMEVNADVAPINKYLEQVETLGVIQGAPDPVSEFVETTFNAIRKGPHCAAASFCFGRETVIPSMFARILAQINISNTDAPKFHYYLERHIEVDGGDHGPKAELLVNYFCNDDPKLVHEAEQTAIEAIKARIKLFDNIKKIIR